MDHPQTPGHPVAGFISLVISLCCGFLASITTNIELLVRIAGGISAIVSAGFAVRYYWYATQKLINK